jgi:hypothetical protein
MRPLSILLIGVALLLLTAAPAAGIVAMPYLSLPSEVVGILNFGPDSVDMTGWTLADDETTDTYTFPSFTLASGKLVAVHAGRGTNSATDLYWSRGSDDAPVWNNDCDIVTLRDRSGTRIADSRGFILGVPTLPRTPVTTMPLVTLPGYLPVSPVPTPYITTPPTGVASHGPITPPYPAAIRTPAPGQTIVPTTLPMPVSQQPRLPLPTSTLRSVLQPAVAPESQIGVSGPITREVRSLPGERRYAIGSPGSLLGTRFGTGGWTTPTGTVRTISTTDTVLKPGSVSFAIAPPASSSFVLWYPSVRWAAGLK